MAQQVTTVTQKGQVTIPAPIRKALKIKPKDRVAFELVDGEVRLRPAKSVVLATAGVVKTRHRITDWSKFRREIEEEIAEEVSREG